MSEAAVISLSIGGTFVLILGIALMRALRAAAAELHAVLAKPRDGSETAAARVSEALDRLADLARSVKMIETSQADFEEQVRRWQGRVNRQAGRDRSEPAEPPATEDALPSLFQGPANAPALPPAGANRPRLRLRR